MACIDAIDPDTWVDIDYTEGGVAQVAETSLGAHRLIVRRTKITDDPQMPALFPEWRHHALVTNRAGGVVELDADHRAHAVQEPVIRDLKHGAGLNHCPSGVFNANAAWLIAASIAHNLLRWVDVPGVATHCPPAGPGGTSSTTRCDNFAPSPRSPDSSYTAPRSRGCARTHSRLGVGSPWNGARGALGCGETVVTAPHSPVSYPLKLRESGEFAGFSRWR